MSALITREPKLDLNITKRRLLRLKVRFGLLSVTLSNACEIKKVCRQHYTVSMAISMD